MRFALSVVLLVALTAPSSSQELPPETERHMALGTSAFECAALAASGASHTSKASALARLGHQETVVGMEVFVPFIFSNAESAGPLGGYLSDQTTDFWAGLAFAEANSKIEEVLDEGVDPELPFELRWDNRQMSADREFERRNCAFLLP